MCLDDPGVSMPFTFSHPAAVLPLRWTRLPFAALVIGSMSPDFIYFLQFGPYSGFGHTLPGVLLLDLPLGLALYSLYCWRLRAFLIALLPSFIQRRARPLTPSSSPQFSKALRVVSAILLGAGTHILWDTFTHAGAWGVAQVPMLGRQVELLGREIFIYKLVQHGSTFLGAGALLSWSAYSVWRSRPDPERQPSPLGWRIRHLCALALLAPSAGLLSAYLQIRLRGGDVSIYGAVVLTIVSAITVGFAYCCVCSVLPRLEPNASQNRR